MAESKFAAPRIRSKENELAVDFAPRGFGNGLENPVPLQSTRDHLVRGGARSCGAADDTKSESAIG
jgi:hypothetical protein